MARVLLLHTGGTLGMEGGRPSALKPGAFFRTLRQRVPELFELAELELRLFSNIDSCEMQPELWSRLARELHEALPSYEGVVVTHGTDTMAYTASALSFMLRPLDRPVVLTGSQRPLGEIRSDARLNLIDAVTAALAGPPEVSICFDSRLLRGNRSRKSKVSDYDAFDSPNLPPLGTLGVETRFARGPKRRSRPTLRARLETRIACIPVYPGLDPVHLTPALSSVRGVLLEAYGAGTLPMAEGPRSLLPFLDEARRRNVVVLLTGPAGTGEIRPTLYTSGESALEHGAVDGADLTRTAAIAKLMHVLAYARGYEHACRMLARPLAGEMKG